jgi:hypothetical protein
VEAVVVVAVGLVATVNSATAAIVIPGATAAIASSVGNGSSATVAVTVISATAAIAMTVAVVAESVIAVFEVSSTSWPSGRYVF